MLKSELEKLKKEKESNQLKIENFNNASKSLDKLIGSQIPDNSKKGVGFLCYNVVPPPPTGLFSPSKLDLSNSSLEEFQQPEFEGYGPKTSNSVSEDISNEVKESHDTPLVKELVSDDKLEKKIVSPNISKREFIRPKQQEKPVWKPVKYVEMYRPNSTVVNAVRENQINAVKALACWVWRPTKLNSASITLKKHNYGHLQKEDQGYVNSGCSRHMIGNMSYLSDFKKFNGGYVTFGGGAKGGKITGEGTLNTGKLDFEDVYFVKELQFNLFSVSQMCDKKNSVLFADTGCFVLSPDFKLADESRVLLKVPKKNNMYNVDMKNIVPKEILTCFVAKATLDESLLWHRRLESGINDQERHENSTQDVNTAGPSINTVNTNVNTGSLNINTVSLSVTIASLKSTHADLFGDNTEVDMSNITTTNLVPSTPNTRIHKDHSLDHVIGDVQSGGHTQEEGIDYDEVFAPVARIEAIRLFLAYTSFKDFVVYQMDMKSAFLYGKIEEEVFVCHPPGFEDPEFPNRVYKVKKALYGLHQAPRAWKELCTEFEKMMHKKFQMSSMGELTFFLGL
nr:copia protein [Tanacetum cinerariifolium]